MQEFQFYNPGAKKKEKKTVNETELWIDNNNKNNNNNNNDNNNNNNINDNNNNSKNNNNNNNNRKCKNVNAIVVSQKTRKLYSKVF